jgi:GntR family transcriptional regulator
MTDKAQWTLDMDAGPIFLQISRNVRALLARGDLQPGEKLPSARDLAQRLGVNPNTVVHAYRELEAENVIETKRGLGTFVREDAPVTAMRKDLLHAAARTFATEIRRLDVPRDEAVAVLKEVFDAGEIG